MIRLGAFVLLCMAGTAVSASTGAWQARSVEAPPLAFTDARANPGGRTPDAAIVAQHKRIQSLLPPGTKEKIGRMAGEFQKRTRKLEPGADLRALATAQVRKEFPNLPPRQINVLAYALLDETYQRVQASAGDISSNDQMMLQQLMEQKSQFETVMSNMLKSMADTSDSIIQNIKS